MVRHRVVSAVWVSSTLAAVIGCSEPLLPASAIRNERVIAVIAEPPEAVPGQQVTLEPVVVSPAGTLAVDEGYQAEWWRCPDSDSDALGDFVPCTTSADRQVLEAGAPFTDVVPTALFGALAPPEPDGAPPSDKLLGAILGYWRAIGLTVVADGRRVDAFKRIPVYLPVRLAVVDPRLAALDSHVTDDGTVLAPNQNPAVTAVRIHEGKRDGPTVSALAQDGTYFFAPEYDDALLEQYISLRVDLEGLDLADPASLQDIPVPELAKRFQKVERCEIPTFSWFVSHGRVRSDTTVDESVMRRIFDEQGIDCPPLEGDERLPEVQYTPPTGDDADPLPADGIVHAWVVMRDGRGGTAVHAFDFTLE